MPLPAAAAAGAAARAAAKKLAQKAAGKAAQRAVQNRSATTQRIVKYATGKKAGGASAATGTTAKVAAGGLVVVMAPALAFTMVFFAAAATGKPPKDNSKNCNGSSAPPPASDDGSPTIQGQSTLTADQIAAWWSTTGKSADPVGVPVATLAGYYVDYGNSEGIRGDIAFAQAINETGWFESSFAVDRYNFAGIAAYDSDPNSAWSFADVSTGVLAHIQLLKKVVLGNDTPLANPEARRNNGGAVTWGGGQVSTWGGLTGVWATSPSYWQDVSSIYNGMLSGNGLSGPVPSGPGGCAAGSGGMPTFAGNYALPLPGSWYQSNPEWFTKPHHDYPSADIPVPLGTEVYASAPGTVISAPVGGDCGLGVIVNGDDGVQYTYCHGSDGGDVVGPDARVESGQLIMHNASTGNSSGPHLHFQMKLGGSTLVCPQNFLVDIAEGRVPNPSALPTSGCTY